MKRKLLSLCVVVLLTFALSVSAFASEFQADRLGSVSVTLLEPNRKTPVADVELSLYYVASVKESQEGKLLYVYTDEFAHCGAALDDLNLTAVLQGYIAEHGLPGQKAVTNEQGTAVFSALPLGLYFVMQTNVLEGYSACRPFLVTVPNTDEKGYVYDVNASPKTEIAKVTDITVLKLWNVDETVEIPDHVTVQLLRDDIVVGEATLNEQNQWRTVFYDMPESDGYSVSEKPVPRGFAATYTQRGYVFTVINTPYLVQTGQLVWPIPVLATIGLLLIVVGGVLLRKSRDANG